MQTEKNIKIDQKRTFLKSSNHPFSSEALSLPPPGGTQLGKLQVDYDYGKKKRRRKRKGKKSKKKKGSRKRKSSKKKRGSKKRKRSKKTRRQKINRAPTNKKQPRKQNEVKNAPSTCEDIDGIDYWFDICSD